MEKYVILTTTQQRMDYCTKQLELLGLSCHIDEKGYNSRCINEPHFMFIEFDRMRYSTFYFVYPVTFNEEYPIISLNKFKKLIKDFKIGKQPKAVKCQKTFSVQCTSDPNTVMLFLKGRSYKLARFANWQDEKRCVIQQDNKHLVCDFTTRQFNSVFALADWR